MLPYWLYQRKGRRTLPWVIEGWNKGEVASFANKQDAEDFLFLLNSRQFAVHKEHKPG